MSKEGFKSFARNHTELANYVLNGKTTWQKLYELYEIYGERSTISKDYFSSSLDSINTSSDLSPLPNNIKDLVQTIKNIDLNSVQKDKTKILHLLMNLDHYINILMINYESLYYS